MIHPLYYTKNRAVKTFFSKKISHFARKERTVVLETIPYVVSANDDIYSIARDIFGEKGEYNWTIISDINGNRKPDDLQVGEVILLPKVILEETFTRLPDYEHNITVATPL